MDLARSYLGEKVIEQGLKFSKATTNNLEKSSTGLKIPMVAHRKATVQGIKNFTKDKESNWYSLLTGY